MNLDTGNGFILMALSMITEQSYNSNLNYSRRPQQQ